MSRLRLTIRTKLLMIVGLVALGIVIAESAHLLQLRDDLLQDRQAKTKAAVDIAYSLVAKYEAEAQSGKMTREAAQQAALQSVRALRYDGEEYFFVFDYKAMLLANPYNAAMEGKSMAAVKDSLGKQYYDELVPLVRDGQGGFVYYMKEKPGGTVPLLKLTYARSFKPWGWAVATGIYIDDIETIFWQRATRSGLIALLVLAVLLVVVLLIGTGIARPVGRLTAKMRQLAAGDLAIHVDESRRHDEIGEMARAVEIFQASMKEGQALRAARDAEQAQTASDRTRELDTLATALRASVHDLVARLLTAAGDMRDKATALATTAEDATRHSAAIACASDQASSNVQTVASAAEELSASIREIARQISQAADISNTAVDQAKTTTRIVTGLTSAATRIGDVVRLITEVAGQTNLLALNATIEAARAGEAGKGFAVVASEVKTLASQTAKATDDITAQVQTIQQEAQTAAEAIKEIAGTIDHISSITSAVAAAVEQQDAATSQIATSVHQAAAGTQQVSSTMATISIAATETAGAAAHVLAAANQLTAESHALDTEIERFVERMRTA